MLLSLKRSLLLFNVPLLAQAYSWNFQAPPKQCSNLTVSITGDGGKPPYTLLIVPIGPTPFSNTTEVRRITAQQFSGDDTSVSFKLNFPANSQLVAVVSDASGFASGGTSAAAVVQNSDDTSCYDASKSVQAEWGFDLNPESLTQCTSTRIFWQTNSAPQGTPSFFGIIPGGESFQIPVGKTDDESAAGQGIGFNYTASIRGGTQLLLVASDNRGNGTGGSVPLTVANGPNNIGTCLNDQSPSSTPGTPAGGSYPTSTDGSGVNGGGNGSGQSNSGGSSSSNGNNIGAIVGGVVGGVALLASLLLLLLFFRRRQKVHREEREKPDLLMGDEGDDAPDARDGAPPRRNELPEYYQPQPFVLPDPTSTTEFSDDRQSLSETTRSRTPDLLSMSGGTSSEYGGPQSSTGWTGYGKKGERTPRTLRPVNIIQHDDAGPSEGVQEEPETIELPPAYNKIKPTGSHVNVNEPAQVEGGNAERSSP